MSATNEQLLAYIRDQVELGVAPTLIKRELLLNNWQEAVVDSAFAELGISGTAGQYDRSSGDLRDTFVRENITMDKIIDKFIPIVGALFLIVGFGYLIYANAWVNLPMEIRLGLGFFFSIAIIGGSFSLAERMRYFTDIGIGSGVLLLYGTLIYGSRATELAAAMIPEVVSLFTALLFTIAVAYFASKRHSKVILILGMVGAYLTPFVIGQHDVWVENVSFNSYLLYFLAINAAVFLMGREISVRDIIPLNIIGLFVGVTTLWGLATTEGISAVQPGDIFTSAGFTAILFMVLVVFSMWSILFSAKRFKEKDDGYLSLGYIAPVIWFAFNVQHLDVVSDVMVGSLYAIIAASCFVGWHVILNWETKFQHTALYAAGLLASFLAVFAFFEEFNVATSMLIAYLSLIFGVLYVLDPSKLERLTSYFIVSLTGSVLSLQHILEADSSYQTLLIVLALLPAMAAHFIARVGDRPSVRPFATAYSIVWSVVALLFVLAEFLDYIDVNFLVFYLVPLTLLGYLLYIVKLAPDTMTHQGKSQLLRMVLFWFAFGFIAVFLSLVVSVYPAPTDTYLFTHTDLPTDWILIKGIFATAILFIGLAISRALQAEQVVRRPSFILVIFGYATLLLTGNYILNAIMNDLEVGLTQGGPRAIATTLWWAAIAIYMLYIGVRRGLERHAEKLLGLLLLGITVIKVLIYDITTMEMQNKIIVLMMVGGAMLLFSYLVRSKNLLQSDEKDQSLG